MKNGNPDLLDLLKDILSALMVLSVIPIPWDKISETPPDFERSFWAFPIVGLILGLLSSLIFIILYYLGVPIILSVSLAIVAGVIFTGGLHEEGFANTFQALNKGKDKKQILELMKNSNINAYGSLSLIFLSIFRITFLTSESSFTFINSSLIDPSNVFFLIILMVEMASSRFLLSIR